MDEGSQMSYSYGSIDLIVDNVSFCEELINLEHRSDDAIDNFIKSTRFDLYWVYTWFFLCTVAVIGPPANLAIMAMIWNNKDMRSKMDLLIFALAFADFSLLVSWTAIVAINLLTSPISFYYPREWRIIVCFVLMTAKDASIYAAIGIVSTISYESYLAVCRPILLSRSLHRRRPLVGIGVLFLLAFLTAVIQVPIRCNVYRVCFKWPKRPRYHTWPDVTETCLTTHVDGVMRIFSIVNWFILSLTCFAMVVIVTVMDVKTYKQLRKLMNNLPNISFRSAVAQRHAVARMIAITGSVCILLLLPYWLFRSLRLLFESLNVAASTLERSLASIFWFLLCSKSLINPFVYVLANIRYRKAFLKMYFPRKIFRHSEVLRDHQVFFMRSQAYSTAHQTEI